MFVQQEGAASTLHTVSAHAGIWIYNKVRIDSKSLLQLMPKKQMRVNTWDNNEISAGQRNEKEE